MALTELGGVPLLERDTRVSLVGVHGERAADVLDREILIAWVRGVGSRMCWTVRSIPIAQRNGVDLDFHTRANLFSYKG